MPKLRPALPLLAPSDPAPVAPQPCPSPDARPTTAWTRRTAVASMLAPLLLLPGRRALALDRGPGALTDVRSGYQAVAAPAGAVLAVAMPAVRRGGLDIVGEGGRLVIPDGRNAGSGPLNLKGQFSSVELNGIRLDLPRDRIADGIGLWGRSPEVTIRNSRVTGVHGQQDKRHGDGIQVGDQAEIDTLVVENTTICSAYQAMIAHRTPNGKGLNTLVLRNVNVRDEPDLRVQLSIALLLGDKPTTGPKNAPYRIVLDNVWVDWPSQDHAVQFPAGATVVGAVKYGVPPRGDFCPA